MEVCDCLASGSVQASDLSLSVAGTGRVVKCASNQLVGAERVTAVEGQLSGGSLSYCGTAVVTNCF